MNKQQLAAKIWESANRMRSKIEANEYKDYILGFIFYKFLSDKEIQFLKNNDWTDEYLVDLNEEDIETVNMVKRNLGYFISYNGLFSTWLKKGGDFSASDVTDAISSFNRNISSHHKKVFEGIFKTLETGLSKLGETSGARTKAIRDLIYLIKDIPMDGRQDYDVLGFIYEYLISNFAANAGKKAGEFYTPHEVSLLMSEIVAHHLQDKNEIKIYDPTSGSGSLLINIGKSAARYVGRFSGHRKKSGLGQGIRMSRKYERNDKIALLYPANLLAAQTYFQLSFVFCTAQSRIWRAKFCYISVGYMFSSHMSNSFAESCPYHTPYQQADISSEIDSV